MEEANKAYQGDLPVAAVRDMSASSSQSSIPSVPQLPALSNKLPLSPIRDVSRETTQLQALPPIGGQRGTVLCIYYALFNVHAMKKKIK